MRVTGLAVLLMTLFSLAPGLATAMNLSDSLTTLAGKLETWQEQSKDSNRISKEQQAQGLKLMQDYENLMRDYDASRISEQQALQRVAYLLTQVQTLSDSLGRSAQKSSELASENAALILDRDNWKARAEWQGKLLRWTPWLAVGLAAAGYAVGRLTR